MIDTRISAVYARAAIYGTQDVMRILFCGQTGIEKSLCVERLARHALQSQGLPADLDNLSARAFLRVFHLENAIADKGDYLAYLDLFHLRVQKERWGNAWDSLATEMTAPGTQHVFLTLHATYFRKNRFFSALDFDHIQQFNPDIVVTLIDDAQECWDRIQVREKAAPRNTNIRLRDVFLWRTVEIMAGDFLAHANNCPHYVLSVKHPLEMVRRLVFEQARKRIYASFPISNTRETAERRDEVDRFRHALHSEFTVFDPLTIDERVIDTARKSMQQDSLVVTIDEALRWPLTWPQGLDPMGEQYDNYPIEIPLDEVIEATEDIDRQIEARDYRLIDQVQRVAAYRPNYGGHISRGVTLELSYAAQVAGIPVHVTWNDDEDGTYGDSPFGAIGTKHNNVDDLINAVNI